MRIDGVIEDRQEFLPSSSPFHATLFIKCQGSFSPQCHSNRNLKDQYNYKLLLPLSIQCVKQKFVLFLQEL